MPDLTVATSAFVPAIRLPSAVRIASGTVRAFFVRSVFAHCPSALLTLPSAFFVGPVLRAAQAVPAFETFVAAEPRRVASFARIGSSPSALATPA